MPEDTVDGPALKKLKGVFSTDRPGHGAKKKAYVYVEEDEDGNILVQPINQNLVPSGPKKNMPRERLLKQYLPDPSMYLNEVAPRMRNLEQGVERADRHRKKEELFTAEFEYKNALRVDEEHIRATFGLALTYLDRGEKDNAEVIFKRLVSLKAAFEEKHKHLFNEFGIKLRKNKMYDEGLQYYLKAQKLCKHDEHLLHNIARIWYEKGRLGKAMDTMEEALELNPYFKKGKAFLEFMKKKMYSLDGM